MEVDETFIGREPGKPKKRAYHHKMKVLTLVDRTNGQARSMVVDNLKPGTIVPILREHIVREARVAAADPKRPYGETVRSEDRFAKPSQAQRTQRRHARGPT